MRKGYGQGIFMADSVPLGYARQWLRDRVLKGDLCPLCHRHTQTYRRTLNATHVSILRTYQKLDRKEPGQWWHAPTVLTHAVGGDVGKLKYWGLLEEDTIRRDDKGHAGFWRITPLGIDWLHGRAKVPKTAHVYGGTVLALSGKPWSVHDALGKGFDLQELLHPDDEDE